MVLFKINQFYKVQRRTNTADLALQVILDDIHVGKSELPTIVGSFRKFVGKGDCSFASACVFSARLKLFKYNILAASFIDGKQF